MNKLIALLYFVLSLYGCDVGGSAYVHHSRVHGADTLYSKAYDQAGVARFECLASVSGQCHYTVLPRECAPASPALMPRATGSRADRCRPAPVERFALAAGDSRQIPGLPSFVLCVTADAATTATDCVLPRAIAAR